MVKRNIIATPKFRTLDVVQKRRQAVDKDPLYIEVEYGIVTIGKEQAIMSRAKYENLLELTKEINTMDYKEGVAYRKELYHRMKYGGDTTRETELLFMNNLFNKAGVHGTILEGVQTLSKSEASSKISAITDSLSKLSATELVEFYENNTDYFQDFAHFYEDLKREGRETDSVNSLDVLDSFQNRLDSFFREKGIRRR